MMVIDRRSHAALARAGLNPGELPQERLCLVGPPPAPQARTTSLARPEQPVSSGYVRTFFLLTMTIAARSPFSQRARGNPSRLSGETSVVSIANWARGTTEVPQQPLQAFDRPATPEAQGPRCSCQLLDTLAATPARIPEPNQVGSKTIREGEGGSKGGLSEGEASLSPLLSPPLKPP